MKFLLISILAISPILGEAKRSELKIEIQNLKTSVDTKFKGFEEKLKKIEDLMPTKLSGPYHYQYVDMEWAEVREELKKFAAELGIKKWELSERLSGAGSSTALNSFKNCVAEFKRNYNVPLPINYLGLTIGGKATDYKNGGISFYAQTDSEGVVLKRSINISHELNVDTCFKVLVNNYID
ncbi:MAG: hypothetical protein HOE90_20875 [Bacteriovoracaceae bacterium]|jgi:hypothetical protein|nr:hypothetical protein [Bacteriovoracaceae bacterium]